MSFGLFFGEKPMTKPCPPPPPKDGDPLQLLTPHEIQGLLRCGRATVDRLAAIGAFPTVTVSEGKRKHSYRVRRSVLEAWIKKTEKKRREADHGNQKARAKGAQH